MRTITLVAAVVALLVVASGVAVIAGVVPLPGDGPDVPPPTPTAEPPQDGTEPPRDATATPGAATGTPPPGDGPAATATPVAEFRIEVRNVEQCGTTCRDVTLALSNVGTASASGVSASVTLYAGNSTAEGDAVWTGDEDVGDLPAGGTFTTTRRVSLSFSEAFAVQQANGWVTIETTIRTDGRTVTFTERRNVT